MKSSNANNAMINNEIIDNDNEMNEEMMKWK